MGYYTGAKQTYWIAVPLLPYLLLSWKRLLLCVLLFFTLFAYKTLCFPDPAIPKCGIHAQIPFFPSSVNCLRTRFGTQWLYQGTATVNEHSIPCMVRLPQKKQKAQRPPADCGYLISGTLKPSTGYRYAFYPDKETKWLPIKKSHSFAEYRYQCKQWVKNYLKKQYSSSRAQEFLAGILTGDFSDPMIKKSFGRAGLQHILAISGFHFSIVTTLLILLLRLFLPQKIALHALLAALFSYFVFLGCGASILRAFSMSLIAIIGMLCRETSSALNSLGFAIFLILALDPQLAFSIGFIFSFAVTASILLFYPSALKLLHQIFPLRSFSKLKQMNMWDQHSYILISFAKSTIALSLAVNITAIPLALFFFEKFPLISLLYNLIIPFMVSAIMFLFILGIAIPWLHPLNHYLIQATLDCVYHLPASLHLHLRLSCNQAVLFTWLTLLVLAGIWIQRKEQPEFSIDI